MTDSSLRLTAGITQNASNRKTTWFDKNVWKTWDTKLFVLQTKKFYSKLNKQLRQSSTDSNKLTAPLGILLKGKSTVGKLTAPLPSAFGAKWEGPGVGLLAFLFDMDGVLFDSMPNHAVSWVEAVRRHGLSMTREEVYMNEGRTGAGTINALTQRTWGRDATEEEIQNIYKTKSDIFNTCPKALPMADADIVLNKVREKGFLPLIVTGSGQVTLLERLNQAYPGVFQRDLMVTAFDVKQGKPYPEPYLKGLGKAGAYFSAQGSANGTPLSDILDENGSLRPEFAVVVENAPLGIRAAKAAGIYCIAVNTGPLPDQTLKDAGADIVLPNMKALGEFIAYRL